MSLLKWRFYINKFIGSPNKHHLWTPVTLRILLMFCYKIDGGGRQRLGKRNVDHWSKTRLVQDHHFRIVFCDIDCRLACNINSLFTSTFKYISIFQVSTQQLLEVPLVSLETCERIFGESVPVHEGQLCAGGEEGRDACSGFGGSPLLVVRRGQYVQVSYLSQIRR